MAHDDLAELGGQCITPREPRPVPGMRRWTLDLCPFIAFGVRKQTDVLDPERGRWGLVSTHKNRAVAVTPLVNQEEVCRHHRGHMTIGPDGHAQPIWCSDPADSQFRQLHMGRMYLAAADAMPELGEPGRAGVFGRYHAPYWFEAILFGSVTRCGAPV